MNARSKEIEQLLKTTKFSLEQVSNTFNKQMLDVTKLACKELIKKLEKDLAILTTKNVKFIVSTDIEIVKYNLSLIRNVISLKSKKLNQFCLN